MTFLEPYKVITVTHHHLNVNEIGHFYLSGSDGPNRVADGLARLEAAFGIQECQYLETCNRVAYIFHSEKSLTPAFVQQFLKVANPSLQAADLINSARFVSTYEGAEAIHHIFKLSASMDSLVVGEREIFRQYRASYEQCKSLGYTGDRLRLLENATVRFAKEVYSKTKIGEKALSIVSLAMTALMKKKVSSDARILLVGAGETNALVAKFLKKYAFTNIKIYNRSLNNAADLADQTGAESFHINELESVEGAFDIIFICTSANKVIIDEKLYTSMLAQETEEKIIVDLAVPRNVGPEVVEQFPVEYVDIESLKKISEANLEFRKKEVEKAQPLLTEHIRQFTKLLHEREIELSLTEVPKEVKQIKQKAIEEVYAKRMEHLDPQAKELLYEMMDYMEKKCVSIPIKLAKSKLS